MTAGAEHHCKKCGNIGGVFYPEPKESVHAGKILCSDCGHFIKWAGKSKTNLDELGRWAVYEEENWKFNFGKYIGLSIKEVMRQDRGFSYCQWLVHKTDFNEKCSSLIDLIEEIAKEEGIVL